jgi:hypothetical protein
VLAATGPDSHSEPRELVGYLSAELPDPWAAQVLKGYPTRDVLAYFRRYRPDALVDE